MELQGKVKKFDEELYTKYDIPARDLMKKIFGDKIADNPDIYGEDLLLNDKECKYKFLELQVCVNWVGDKYPYDYPFVYERKSKFSDDTLYLVLDRHMTQGLLFDKKSLKKTPRRLKRYSRYFVYEVHWNRVMTVYMDNFDIETVKLYC
jgi:hypothetical protein